MLFRLDDRSYLGWIIPYNAFKDQQNERQHRSDVHSRATRLYAVRAAFKPPDLSLVELVMQLHNQNAGYKSCAVDIRMLFKVQPFSDRPLWV